MRYRRRTRRIEPLHADHDPVASFPLFAKLHKPRKRGACDRILQDRMCNTRGLQRRNCKSGKQTCYPHGERKAERTPARHKGNRHRADRER